MSRIDQHDDSKFKHCLPTERKNEVGNEGVDGKRVAKICTSGFDTTPRLSANLVVNHGRSRLFIFCGFLPPLGYTHGYKEGDVRGGGGRGEISLVNHQPVRMCTLFAYCTCTHVQAEGEGTQADGSRAHIHSRTHTHTNTHKHKHTHLHTNTRTHTSANIRTHTSARALPNVFHPPQNIVLALSLWRLSPDKCTFFRKALTTTLQANVITFACAACSCSFSST
jgi:hypothetical protein